MASSLTYHNDTKVLIQGRYLEGVFSSKGRLKWLRIEADRREWLVKLPKYIGLTLSREIEPGVEIRVWARPKKDYFKALMVVPLTPRLDVEPFSDLPMALPPKSKPLIIKICQKGGCRKRGGKYVWDAIQHQIELGNTHGKIRLEATGCLKNCKHGPNMCIGSKQVRYSRVQASQIPAILSAQMSQ